MSAIQRVIALILVVIAGLWLGFVVPFGAFLLTGLPLAAIFAVALATACVGLILNERRGPSGVRSWLRALSVGIGFGVLLQIVYVLAGGWSFGS